MSAFLGQIHFWLYNKIGKQEALTKAIADYGLRNCRITGAEKYTKVLPPLETVIDEGNIHGWLQAQIADAETRYAELVSVLISHDRKHFDALCSVAFNFGKEHTVKAADAPGVYKAFEDFFVNGMPCDRVNAVTENSPERVAWEMTKDIHAQYWNEIVGTYYALRKFVMDGMLLGTGFKVEMSDDAHYTITKN